MRYIGMCFLPDAADRVREVCHPGKSSTIHPEILANICLRGKFKGGSSRTVRGVKSKSSLC